MSYDSRGVWRGTCTEYGCLCIGYDGGVEMKKCVKCFHPPGKHKNLSDSGSVGSATVHYMGAHTTPHNMGGSFQSNPATMSHPYNAGSVQLHQQSHFHHHHPHHEPRPQPQLPQCQANGCFNPVHCDPSLPEGLRVFAYCSPECRDRHLLPMERVNLTVDLGDMKKKLQEVAAAEKSRPNPSTSSVLQRQLSNEHSGPRVLGGPAGVNTAYNSASTSIGAGHSTSGTTSYSPFGGAGHILGSSDKKPKEQKTSALSVTKLKSEVFGVLLSKRPHTSDKAFGFLIIGATYGTPAHTLMQNDKIRIFDVIQSVNDKTCSDLFIPPNPVPQQCFDWHLKDRTSVRLQLLHTISLPPISDLLNKANRGYNHLIALRYSPDCHERAYGLTLNSSVYSQVSVGGRTGGTPAYDSGIEFGDEIYMYAVASVAGIGAVKEVTSSDDGAKLCTRFDKAQSAKESVILMIRRSTCTRV